MAGHHRHRCCGGNGLHCAEPEAAANGLDCRHLGASADARCLGAGDLPDGATQFG